MKVCPTCNRIFDDETLSFCLEDGTPLVRDSAGRADSQETLVSPSPSVKLTGNATINASQFNAPSAQVYVPAARQRRTWPWVVGILLIVFIVIGGIVIAAVFIPPMLRDTGNDNRPQPTPTRSEWTTTPTPSASPSAAADEAPDDEDLVLSQLTKVEEEWTRANVKGDKAALERILAEEYVGGPTSHTKRQYIDSLAPDPSIKSWELVSLTVDQTGDRATVHGTLKEETTNGSEAYNFADTFVWRDHRWQAVASRTSSVK